MEVFKTHLAKLLQSLTRKRVGKKGIFSMYMDFPFFTLCPLSVACHKIHWDVWLSILHSPNLIIDIDKIPAKLFFSGQSTCSLPRSDSPIPLTLPYTGLTPVYSCVFCRAQHWCQNSRYISPVLSGEEGSTSPTCWQHFLIQPGRLLNLLCLLHRNIPGTCTHWFPPQTPGSCLKSCFSVGHQCRRLFLLSYRTLHFPYFYFSRFLPDHFSSLPKSLYWIPQNLRFDRPTSHCPQSFHQI